MPTTRRQARAASGDPSAVKPKTTPKKTAASGKKTPKGPKSSKKATVKEETPPKADDKRKLDDADVAEIYEKETKQKKTGEGQDVKQAEKANGAEKKETRIEKNIRTAEEEEKKFAGDEKNTEDKENDVKMANADDDKRDNNLSSGTANGEAKDQMPSSDDTESVKKEDVKQESDTSMNDAPAESKINPQTEQPETVNGTPNPIIEKGTFYFFYRSKIDIEEPESLSDIQRAYLVLRPIPHGQKPGDSSVKNEDINRVLIFPKKKFPSVGHHEREISFIDVTNVSVDSIRDTVLSSRTYSTKTKGERTLSPCTPVASGVYSILTGTSDRSTHFAYILTSPSDPTEVTTEFGLSARGSFVISVRNPEFAPPRPGVPGGSNVDMPKELMDRFNGLRWRGVDKDYLNVEGAQILWIGERSGIKIAGEEGKQEEVAEQDLEGLEEEDKERVEALKSDDPVFDDLSLSAKEFEGLKVSWD